MGLDIYFEKAKRNRNEEDNSTEFAYFRKVNFLVEFMNKFGEVENCEPFEISKEICQELLDNCETILKEKDENQKEMLARKLLPTTSGFFFGSTDYDEWYYRDVKEVRDAMKQIIEEFDALAEDEYIYFYIWY